MAERVPEIRTEGFTDSWEQRKFGETVEISTDMVDPKTGIFDNLIHIGPGDIEPQTGQLLPGVKTVAESDLISGKFHFFPGDVIYSKIRPELSKCVIAPDEGLASADAYVLHGKGSIRQDFLYTLLHTKQFHDYSTAVSMRTGMPKVNREELSSYIFYAPTLPEQQRIGSFLMALDNLITLHQREYDKLVTAKTTFLQRMYPEQGSDEARLRFGGYSGPYEHRQTKTIFREYDVRDHAGLPVLSAHQKLGMVPRDQIGYEIFHDEAQEKTYKHIKPGQFVIHLRSFQGGFAHSAFEGIASPAYTVMEFAEEGRDYDLYWKHLFMSRRFIDSLRVVTYGIRDGRSISVPEFKELYFYTPCYEEQRAIGDFFEELDRLIGLEAVELEKLKHVKSTLLRKMFV